MMHVHPESRKSPRPSLECTLIKVYFVGIS
jgi:hypothetical protein